MKGQARVSEIIDQMVNHLEFLGYTVERGEQSIRLTHAKHLNFVLREFSGGVLLSDYFKGNDHARANRADFVAFANGLNQKAALARFYVDDETDLMVEAWLPGLYDKAAFATAMDAWQRDGSTLLGHEAVQTFLG